MSTEGACAGCGAPGAYPDYMRRVDTLGTPLRWCAEHSTAEERLIGDYEAPAEAVDRAAEAIWRLNAGGDARGERA